MQGLIRLAFSVDRLNARRPDPKGQQSTVDVPTIRIVPLAEVSADAVEHLLDRAFGRDRRQRTAYHIRTGTTAIPALSFAAIDAQGNVLGTIQCWPIALHGDDDRETPLIMLGPVAVEPALQRSGIGRQLTAAALAVADAQPMPALMLIGDPEYYGRFFGFSADRTAQWRVPGPVERHRLLARGVNIPADAGMLGPRLRVDA
jgi:predicted N-acetyltransferase YhbS